MDGEALAAWRAAAAHVDRHELAEAERLAGARWVLAGTVDVGGSTTASLLGAATATADGCLTPCPRAARR